MYALDFRERAPAAITPAASSRTASRSPRCRARAGSRSRVPGEVRGLGEMVSAGARCRSARASSRRRSWRPRVSRVVAAGGRRTLAGQLRRQGAANAARSTRSGVRRRSSYPAASRSRAGDAEAARARLDAGQAARGRRGRVLQGRDRRPRSSRRSRPRRRDDAPRISRRYAADRSRAARGRVSRAARVLDAAAVVGRRRADRDAGDPGGALPRRGGADQAGAQLVGVPARAGRGVQARASPIARASWATPTSSRSTSRT